MDGSMRRLTLLLLLIAGCAPTNTIVDGKTVPRLDMDFVGQPFVVRVSAAHPRPGSPSGGLREFGGRISGNICGLDVTYDVQHAGDNTHLTGFIDENQMDSRLDVKDVQNISRQITGTLDSRGTGVNLDLRKNHIRGNVGIRQFDLGRQGDQYIGWVKVTQMVTASATINGADELWSLPPAAQAVVLPALLTCYGDELEGNRRGSLVVGFGGRQTWEGKHVSAIYHNTADMQRTMIQGSKSGTVAP
ncbi:MAG: hypothetical protein JWN44_2407 [Myxococcales bacterium]|nr:hypothetical protein [Myxococcales bacterium]